MGAAVDSFYTFVGVCAGLFGFRRLQEEASWRSWPATVGRVEEDPKKAYRVWQDYHLSLPLYTVYKYYIRDRPGIFLSVRYSYSLSDDACARGRQLLSGAGPAAGIIAEAPGEKLYSTGELRITRDIAELRPEQVRIAAAAPEVEEAVAKLPIGREVVVHYNPAMPKHNCLRPPEGFRRFNDGELEGLTVINAGLLLVLLGRRRGIKVAFAKATR